MNPSDDTKIEIIHDHYKETFSYIREKEKKRDFLFIIIIALIGILFLEVQYSGIFSILLNKVKLNFAEVDLSVMPISIFLSVTWTYLFMVVLRYCQSSIFVERNYDYLHKLEEKISGVIGDKKIYCREGRSYLDNYPLFSDLVWIFYVALFPIITIVTSGWILYSEWIFVKSPFYHLVYDSFISISIITSFAFYRVIPLLKNIFVFLWKISCHATKPIAKLLSRKIF